MTRIKYVLISFSFLFFMASCSGDNDCPEGMHEETLNDGTVICVPD